MALSRIGTLLIAITAGANLLSLTPAQEPPTYKVDVEVVNVLATVRDQKGRLVQNLSKDDFILEEDGRKQEILYFSRQSDLPLTLGLLIDTSFSQRRLIDDERTASYQFFEQVLRPERDQAFVIRFDFDSELLQDITPSKNLLDKALRYLKTTPAFRRSEAGSKDPVHPRLVFAQWPGGGRGSGRRGGGTYPGGQQPLGGTVMYDAVFLASDEILNKEQGRKAIILISDGVDHGSKISELEAIDAAHRADTLVYSIRYYDSDAYNTTLLGGEGKTGTKALKALSQETGGRMFEVSSKRTLREIYDQIQEELRNQYSIGYTPPNTGGAEFRRFKLLTKNEKLQVLTRAGYYPKKSQP
jgi:VWFA-related protein